MTTGAVNLKNGMAAIGMSFQSEHRSHIGVSPSGPIDKSQGDRRHEHPYQQHHQPPGKRRLSGKNGIAHNGGGVKKERLHILQHQAELRLPFPQNLSPSVPALWRETPFLLYPKKTKLLVNATHCNVRSTVVIEPLLLGIVLGLIPVTLAGLFVAAYLQYKRGNVFDLE